MEQRKNESIVKRHADQVQELIRKETERRESEVKREVEERRKMEKEHVMKLEDLH